MKYLLILATLCIPAFAQPSCTANTVAVTVGIRSYNVTTVCNVSFDATVPSGQTYSRYFGCIKYVQGTAALATQDIVVMAPGKGWAGNGTNICATSNPGMGTLANNLVAQKGWVAYLMYDTWASAGQVAASSSAGAMSLQVELINTNASGATWFPGYSGCVDGCAGITTPFNAVYGSPGAGDQETISVTGQSGTNNLVWAVSAGTVNNHGANELIYIPKTQFPASISDWASALSWIAANAGQGTYPGNPQRIHIFANSSDLYNALMTVLSPKGSFLGSCPVGFTSHWGAAGNQCGSSNSSTAYSVVNVAGAGSPWDLNWMMNNSSSGPPSNYTTAQSVIPAMLGLIPGTDSGGAAFATAASPTSLLSTTTYHGSIQVATGGQDYTTPPCLINTCWGASCGGTSPYSGYTPSQAPCTGNMYGVSGIPFVVWTGTGAGHTGDCTSNPTPSGQCYPWLLSALTGGAAGSGQTSTGTVGALRRIDPLATILDAILLSINE